MTLVIAGLGIKFLSHLTKETEKVIQCSDKVLYLSNDVLFPEWILAVNKNAESLESLYFSQPDRYDAYNAIKDKILMELVQYKNVSFIVYGNPNFLVQITALVENAARNKGHTIHILPAISSLDCLLADLNINPGSGGMQIFEATELIICRKIIDITSHIVIFQPAAIGQNGHDRNKVIAARGMQILCEYLHEFYNADQPVVFYEASQSPKKKSSVITVSLKEAVNTEVTSKTTLYIAPAKQGNVDQCLARRIQLVSANLNASSKKSGI